MTYLLDTNVLSETRKRQPAVGVSDWIAATPPGQLHVSVLTLGEIEQGIARVLGRGDRHQAFALGRWLREVEAGFEDRVLPVTLRIAAAWGRQQYAQPIPVIDALIAATAQVHDMTLVTRNIKDFELAGVQILNPFAELARTRLAERCGLRLAPASCHRTMIKNRPCASGSPLTCKNSAELRWLLSGRERAGAG